MYKLANSQALTIAGYLIGIFFIIEVVGGIMSNSLALLADAGHMLSDFLAIMLSLIACKYQKKPADQKRSYGYGRMQIIASFVNGITLLGISFAIAIAACIRLFEPPTVEPQIMLVIAIIGIIVNALTFFILHMSNDKNLSMRGAMLHVLGDLLGFISAAISAILIKYTGWYILDPILSIFISLLLVYSALGLIKESLHILMEGAPNSFTEEDIRGLLCNINGVVDVQHIHLWLLTDNYTVVTLHLILNDDVDPFSTIIEAQNILALQKQVQHATIAVERYNPQHHEECHYNHHHM